jgi:diguanylate cyclase (GGDEF)-like protein
MKSRYLPLAVYVVLLAVGTGCWLAYELQAAHDFPPLWVVALCVGASLLVFQFGVPVPRVGLTSMERLPQIGMLLIFSPAVAATISATASALWPLINRSYSQGSLKVAVLRAVHNLAMTALMLLVAAKAYEASGGQHPLQNLTLSDAGPLVAMALAMQVVNILAMAVFFRLDGRDVRLIITPTYALIDLVFVPAGVLAAVLYNGGQLSTFLLFAALMTLFVFSFNGVTRTFGGGAEPDPFARLWRTGRALHGARHIDELGDRILTETRALFRFDEFHFALVDREQRLVDVRVHERLGKRLRPFQAPIEEGLLGWVAETSQPLLIEAGSALPPAVRERLGDFSQSRSVILVPLVENGAAIGVVGIQHKLPDVYSRADLNLMQRLAEQLAQALADARAFEDLERYRRDLEERVAARTQQLEQANRENERLIAALAERSRALERETQEDPLTGIANRRAFSQRLKTELELARAVNRPLTIAVADLDHFKIVNDRLGHLIGDEVLRRSALIMRRICRATDLVARIGGEEFAFILPGMPLEAATQFCEAVRHAVQSHDWQSVHPHLRVTLSIGISQWTGEADVDALLQAADARLYRAKHAGRNRVA